MRILARIFNEVYTLVDVVYMMVSRGVLVSRFSCCLFGSFVLVAYIVLLLVKGYES